MAAISYYDNKDLSKFITDFKDRTGEGASIEDVAEGVWNLIRDIKYDHAMDMREVYDRSVY